MTRATTPENQKIKPRTEPPPAPARPKRSSTPFPKIKRNLVFQ